MSSPEVALRIAVGKVDQDVIVERMRSVVERVAAALHLDVSPQVEISSCADGVEPRFWIDDQRLRYSKEDVVRAWMHQEQRLLTPEETRSAMRRMVERPTATLLAALFEAALIAGPEALVTESVAAHAVRSDKGLDPKRFVELLKFAVSAGVGVGELSNRPDLVKLGAYAAAGSSTARAEQFLSGLHPHRISIRIGRRDLESMLASDPHRNGRPLARIHSHVRHALGLPLPDIRIAIDDGLTGMYALTINHLEELSQPLLPGDQLPRLVDPLGLSTDLVAPGTVTGLDYLALDVIHAIEHRAARMVESVAVAAWCSNLREPALLTLVSASRFPDDVPRILRALVDEGVSIRDLARILESIVDYQDSRTLPPRTHYVISTALPISNNLPPSTTQVVEWVRKGFGSSIRDRIGKSQLNVVVIDPAVEEALVEDTSPPWIEELLQAVIAMSEEADALLVTAELRPTMRQLCRSSLPLLTVLTLQDLPLDTNTNVIGTIRIPSVGSKSVHVARTNVEASVLDGFGLLLADLRLGTAAFDDFVYDESPPASPPPPTRRPATLASDPLEDHDSVKDQGWGLVVPAGVRGDELLAAVAPLIEFRSAEQEAPCARFRVPDGVQPFVWVRDVYESLRLDTRPRYLLILGDLDEVPMELQQALSSLAAVGRIAFDSVPEYAAYAAKVVDCEMRPRRSTVRPVVFSGEDQSRAIAIAKASLVSPWLDRIRALTGDSRWRIDATTVASNGTAGLIEAARDADVLFTVTHGVGSNMSYSERRTLQGALLTRPGDLLRGEDVSTSRFVPGGVWFMHACYGAGTPSTSIYAQWIQDLYSSERLKARQLKSITEASLGPTERPFVAQLPKCALANPEGPLAIIAHLDLAWTYGFLHDGDRLFSSIRIALRGSRVGRAIEQIANKHLSVSDQLAELYAARRGQKSSNPREVAQLWMLRQDLRSYVLLGDPAARVNLTERRTTT